MQTNSDARILLVDDVPDNHLAMRVALEDLRDRLVCVDSGKKALRRLLDEDFGLILLDVNMPEMDGFEVAGHIKKIERLRHIPIIFLSAVRQEEAEVFKAYSVGALDYLFTPFNPHILRAKVNSFLLLHDLTASVRQQADDLIAINDSLRIEILERQRAEDALREAQVQLEAHSRDIETATRLKSEFLANMSHEIRTPLNSIIGFSQILLDRKQGTLNSKQEEYLQDVLASGAHLLQLINDILDLAKVESGKVEFSPAWFAPSEAAAEVCAVIKGIADRRRIIVTQEAGAPIPDVFLDERRFKQILYNLLSNAVKFTPEAGCVKLKIFSEEGKRLIVEVEDTGVGIAPPDLKRLFHEFEQGSLCHPVRDEGTGLGLALTRKLIEAQNGTINVASKIGIGTLFTVALPIAGDNLNSSKSDASCKEISAPPSPVPPEPSPLLPPYHQRSFSSWTTISPT